MGTPDFARRPLDYLFQNSRHEILAVVTGQDKPSGRGRRLQPTAVKRIAEKFKLPVLMPMSLKSDDFINQIKKLKADIFVVVAFRILPEKLFTIPKFGSINLHASLLPKYRGAAPINWALINGERETGLTTFFLKQKIDSGNIIYQEKIEIGDEEIFDELHARLSEKAGPVLDKTLDLIEAGDVTPCIQDNLKATPAPKLNPYDCLIDFGFPAQNVINFIRGLSSVPGAFTYFRGKKLKIFCAGLSEIKPEEKLRPGTIISQKNHLLVAVADRVIEIKNLRPEGKKSMTGGEFVSGYQPAKGELMGERVEGELSNQ